MCISRLWHKYCHTHIHIHIHVTSVAAVICTTIFLFDGADNFMAQHIFIAASNYKYTSHSVSCMYIYCIFFCISLCVKNIKLKSVERIGTNQFPPVLTNIWESCWKNNRIFLFSSVGVSFQPVHCDNFCGR